MINKKAVAIQMTSDISDSEIESARFLCDHFSKIEGRINVSLDHLNGLYDPFKSAPQIPVDETIKNRIHLRDFRDQVIENFNEVIHLIKDDNFKKKLKHFSIDTEINELISSFDKTTDDIIKQVNLFLKVFSNLYAVDFKDRVVSGIDNIKKQCAQLNQLLTDRLISHIEDNILTTASVNNLKEVKFLNKEKENLINKFASFNFKV